MNSVSFIFYIIVLEDLLQVINILSNQLQQISATLGKAVSVIHGVIQTLKGKHTDVIFSDVWSNVKLFAEMNNIEFNSLSNAIEMDTPNILIN